MENILRIAKEENINPFTLDLAKHFDEIDPLKGYRYQFHIPKVEDANNNDDDDGLKRDSIYLCGNSLGLQPKSTRKYIEQELQNWEKYGVEGQFCGENPWVTFDEVCVKNMAEIVGAKPIEVCLMNTLTVNLHLMLSAFYNPTETRFKILLERDIFPSDYIAALSHSQLKGQPADSALILIHPREGEDTLRDEDILKVIEDNGEEIALVLLGGVNYLTGQVLDMESISRFAKSKGCVVGFDLAHAVGNVILKMHDWDVDFAVWCTYKYLNSGPGGIGGCFVHERHARDFSRPRLAGWWSHDKSTRFLMKSELNFQEGAFGFQISNPSILCLASLKSSLDIYHEMGMDAFVAKSKLLTGYLYMLLTQQEHNLRNKVQITTPSNQQKRGCQLSLIIQADFPGKHMLAMLKSKGVIGDFREPNCIRVAPNPFYNTFADVFNFVHVLIDILKNGE